MTVSQVRSDRVNSKIRNTPLDKENDIYLYKLIMPCGGLIE